MKMGMEKRSLDRRVQGGHAGHSSGTSGADRKFNISLNDSLLFVLITPKQKKGNWELNENFHSGVAYSFSPLGYDINGDAFGFLFIQVPSVLVSKKANFQFFGPDQQSRDWLMVFDYRCGLRIDPQPTSLVLREENRRQLNVFIDNPYPSGTVLSMSSSQEKYSTTLVRGYNVLHIPFSKADFSGVDTLIFKIGNETVVRTIHVLPSRQIKFALIHHSHNDIGYSHLQTEVERIQTENIRAALRWVSNENKKGNNAFWHIESLWALENFLRNSTDAEKAHFFETVRSGRISLSANYANVLTGLCRRKEHNWNTESSLKISITISSGEKKENQF